MHTTKSRQLLQQLHRSIHASLATAHGAQPPNVTRKHAHGHVCRQQAHKHTGSKRRRLCLLDSRTHLLEHTPKTRLSLSHSSVRAQACTVMLSSVVLQAVLQPPPRHRAACQTSIAAQNRKGRHRSAQEASRYCPALTAQQHNAGSTAAGARAWGAGRTHSDTATTQRHTRHTQRQGSARCARQCAAAATHTGTTTRNNDRQACETLSAQSYSLLNRVQRLAHAAMWHSAPGTGQPYSDAHRDQHSPAANPCHVCAGGTRAHATNTRALALRHNESPGTEEPQRSTPMQHTIPASQRSTLCAVLLYSVCGVNAVLARGDSWAKTRGARVAAGARGAVRRTQPATPVVLALDRQCTQQGKQPRR
jgi:hypothetical protein